VAKPPTTVIPAARPSALVDEGDWRANHDWLIRTLVELIRIPSINPPEQGDGELRAATYIADVLREAGLEPEVVEPYPGRGSVGARLRGDGTGGDPLLLLSHLDVVPAPPDDWSHDPFGGDVVDGYVWGRGAVDMKETIAMQLAVVRRLADEARAVGRDPSTDPIPGLTRDVLFAATADEEAGGLQGIGWLVDNRPDWLQAEGALTEAGGVAVTVAGRRIYPIQVAEKGYGVYRIFVRGSWGHGSMPRSDNAAVRAADAITRLAAPGPPRLVPVMERLLNATAAALPAEPGRLVRTIGHSDVRLSEAAIESLCDPAYARATRALLRDTISPTIVHAGVKYNVIPGVAEIHVDCRVLPGTSEEKIQAELIDRLGDLADECEVDLVIFGEPVESPVDTDLYRILDETIRDHDNDGAPVPAIVPFATDAKHTGALGIPTYGFSPLQLAPDEVFIDRWHGVDERVGLDALRWGLPVLYDAVRRFCGSPTDS
jgi:acetylornithine deacetylase/succinyl-diaminopimelate desuccinylase-like protein